MGPRVPKKGLNAERPLGHEGVPEGHMLAARVSEGREGGPCLTKETLRVLFQHGGVWHSHRSQRAAPHNHGEEALEDGR